MSEYHDNLTRIRTQRVDDFVVYEIDPKKVSWHGRKLRELNAFGKRKFENLLVMMNPTERIKIVYVNV